MRYKVEFELDAPSLGEAWDRVIWLPTSLGKEDLRAAVLNGFQQFFIGSMDGGTSVFWRKGEDECTDRDA